MKTIGTNDLQTEKLIVIITNFMILAKHQSGLRSRKAHKGVLNHALRKIIFTVPITALTTNPSSICKLKKSMIQAKLGPVCTIIKITRSMINLEANKTIFSRIRTESIIPVTKKIITVKDILILITNIVTIPKVLMHIMVIIYIMVTTSSTRIKFITGTIYTMGTIYMIMTAYIIKTMYTMEITFTTKITFITKTTYIMEIKYTVETMFIIKKNKLNTQTIYLRKTK